VASQAKRISDEMMMAAAIALSELAPAAISGEGRLLPELASIRKVSKHIAKAVIMEAIKEKHAKAMEEAEIDKAIEDTFWLPQYESFVSGK
jgi:malate dehydrogenase (oxaloacetate-decarboxylating)